MSSAPEGYKIAMSVTSCICHDQRVLKTAGILRDLNCDITLIGRRRNNCKEEKIPFKTVRFRMFFTKSFLFYMFFNIRLYFYLLFNRFDLLVANDLDTLLPNFLVSWVKRLPLVYDSHEYFTGVPEIQNRPVVKAVWTAIEKMIFPRLKYIMTVSDSIAERYYSEYGIRPITVRNCSPSTTTIEPYQKKALGLDENDLLLILQGTGINIDRGAEELLEAVYLTRDVSLLIVGSGDIMENLKKRTRELNIQARVKFIPVVKWPEMIRYTKSADAGISLDKNTNPNYFYSLPNKLFDYISSGIPVIVSNLPEVSGIVREAGCGLIIDDVTPEKISEAIILLRDNHEIRTLLRMKANLASAKLNWESESVKVIEFYKSIFKNLQL